MSALRVTALAHDLVRSAIQPGDWVIDATVGNGHDTAMLAERIGPTGRLFGFDIQATALATAKARIAALTRDVAPVELFQHGHETMTEHLPDAARGRIAAVMFNLGYLPGADHAVTTAAETTQPALTQAMDLLAPRGRMTVIAYRGHPAGMLESQAVRAFAEAQPATVAVTHIARLGTAAPAPELFVFDRIA